MLSAAVLLLLGAAVVWFLWRRTAAAIKLHRKLKIRVERCMKRWELPTDGLLHLLEIDPAAAPPLTPGLRLMSLGDYFTSLQTTGSVSFERAIVSIADRFGLAAALPLALFLPNRWRAERAAGGLLSSFPSLAATALVTTALSTLDCVSFATTTHLYASKQRRKAASASAGEPLQAVGAAAAAKGVAGGGGGKPAEEGPLVVLLRGGVRGDAADPLAGAPVPLQLTRTALVQQLGLSPADLNDTVLPPGPDARPMSPLLPDLYLGNGGLPLDTPTAGIAAAKLMAAVANRLTANALVGLAAVEALLPGMHQGALAQPFQVCLRPGGRPLEALEDLLGALRATGHSVSLRILSNLTSFGAGLSCRGADGSWTQIPLAYPLRCAGLWAEDEHGRPLDVLTLMSHGSIVLSVAGPLLDFKIEWCISVAGFCGWLPHAGPKREWAIGPVVQMEHPLLPDNLPASGAADAAGSAAKQQLTPEERRLVRLITAATCICDVAAQRDRLLFGGYGMLGVCLDSVAAIQQAMIGRCTIYPLLLGGEAKFSLMALDHQAHQAGWAYGREALELGAALAALPCDALAEPDTAAYAARRALACLPERSVFTAVAACRKSLQAALAAAERLCPSKTSAAS